MADIKEDKKQEDNSLLSQPQAAKSDHAPAVTGITSGLSWEEKEKRKSRTWGNVIFDWGVYSTIAWAGVSAFSLGTAHLAMNSKAVALKPLRSLYQGLKGGTASVLTKFMKKTPSAEIEKWASGTALYYILGTGGSFLMWPIKYMEDNRQKLACKIDKFLGTTPPDPELIEREPKQTWKSVLAGRALSVIGIGYGSFVLMGPERADRISKWFGGKFTDGWMKFSKIQHPEQLAQKRVKVRKAMDMAAFDVLFTAITASVMYGFSRFVARRQERLSAKNKHDAIIAADTTTTDTLPEKPLATVLPEPVITAQIDEVEKKPVYVEKVEPRKKPEKSGDLFASRVAGEVPEPSLQPGV